ncbi:hypothetical protein PE067_08890 [Paracoccus sp. DMF-8]|uniref:hypothetical protein n=1 Tax=Paracoccus sp. DMF-8 TaxID=3019445 RepID=UPI0023E7F528|nr:hypothetical protein [Paracoccus sp. DMF-8]MDF3606238.1 hypothetical protein [Paracoccus sp. DMF-8]
MLWDMEDDCGHDVLRAFLLAHGGRQVSVASKPIGEVPGDLVNTALRWLQTHIGHGRITVPSGLMAYHARLAWTIYHRLMRGQSLAEISAALHVHSRTVSNHRARLINIGVVPQDIGAARPQTPNTKDPR